MPLIETVTGPDLRTPDEVAEAILLVGRVCRSTGHVRVGHRRQPPGRERVGARRPPRGDQGRAEGRLGAATGARRGGAAGEPAAAAGRAASAAASRRPESIAVESADVTELFAASRGGIPAPSRGGSGSCKRRSGVAGLRAGQRAVLRARRAAAGAGGTLALADAARLHLRPRAGGPRAGDRRARPAADPAAQREVARLPAARCRNCAGCATQLRLQRGRRRGGGLGAGRGHGDRGGRDPAALRRRDRRRPERDAPAVCRRHPPTSSGSCRGPTGCTRTRTARRTRVTRERVERLRAGLAPRPWEREARYARGRRAASDHPLPDPTRRQRGWWTWWRGRVRRAGQAGVRASSANSSRGCAAQACRWTRSPTRGGASCSRASAAARCSGRRGTPLVRAMAAAPEHSRGGDRRRATARAARRTAGAQRVRRAGCRRAAARLYAPGARAAVPLRDGAGDAANCAARCRRSRSRGAVRTESSAMTRQPTR